jgi:1-acyl-sn-glycerol-3-phosphate acyltransferase
MSGAVQWIRSVVFIVQMYVAMAVIGIALFPWALVSKRGAQAGCKAFCLYVRWSAGWMVGLRSEIRGTPPKGAVMIAAKHQSFFDIILIFAAVPAGKFIMKQELLWTPILGQYAMRIGCIPVNRGKRGAAIKKMVEDVARGAVRPGQLIIYPQGTRVAPGAQAPSKVGVGVLYRETGQPVVPVATNAGAFWPRTGIWRRPGTVVVEFLPVIEPGLAIEPFMERLEREVETASDRLLEETGLV